MVILINLTLYEVLGSVILYKCNKGVLRTKHLRTADDLGPILKSKVSQSKQ